MSMLLREIIKTFYSTKVNLGEISALGSVRKSEKMAEEKRKYNLGKVEKNRKRKLQIAEVN